MLCRSSATFLIPAAFAFAKGLYIESIAILIVVYNSLMYHYYGDQNSKYMDIFSNFLFGSIFVSHSILTRNIPRIAYATLAVIGYLITRKSSDSWLHILGVHVPTFFGLLAT